MIERVLAPHLGDDALDVALAGRGDRGLLVDRQADGARAGEGDHRHLGVLDQSGPTTSPRPGRNCTTPGGAPPATRASISRHATPGDLLGRLEDHGVAGDQRGHGHAGRDRQGEVPGGDDRGHTLALVDEPVGLPRRGLHEVGGRAVEAQHLPPVVLAEVDRLADVGVGLVPGLAGLEALEGGDLVTAAPHPVGGPEQHGRPLPGRRPAPVMCGPCRDGHGGIDVGRRAGGGAGHDGGGHGRIHRRQRVGGGHTLAPDQGGHPLPQAGRHGTNGGGHGVACRPAAPLGDRLRLVGRGVGGIGGHPGLAPPGHRKVPRTRGRQQLVEVSALGKAVPHERLVGRVFEQSPHQVRHSRHELAHRRVDPQPEAEPPDGFVHGLGHAVEHLNLVAGIRDALAAGVGDGVGE